MTTTTLSPTQTELPNKYIYPEFQGAKGKRLLISLASKALTRAEWRTWLTCEGITPHEKELYAGTNYIARETAVSDHKIAIDLHSLEVKDLYTYKKAKRMTNGKMCWVEIKDFTHLYHLAHQLYLYMNSENYIPAQRDMLPLLKEDPQICKHLMRFECYRSLLCNKKPGRKPKASQSTFENDDLSESAPQANLDDAKRNIYFNVHDAYRSNSNDSNNSIENSNSNLISESLLDKNSIALNEDVIRTLTLQVQQLTALLTSSKQVANDYQNDKDQSYSQELSIQEENDYTGLQQDGCLTDNTPIEIVTPHFEKIAAKQSSSDEQASWYAVSIGEEPAKSIADSVREEHRTQADRNARRAKQNKSKEQIAQEGRAATARQAHRDSLPVLNDNTLIDIEKICKQFNDQSTGSSLTLIREIWENMISLGVTDETQLRELLQYYREKALGTSIRATLNGQIHRMPFFIKCLHKKNLEYQLLVAQGRQLQYEPAQEPACQIEQPVVESVVSSEPACEPATGEGEEKQVMRYHEDFSNRQDRHKAYQAPSVVIGKRVPRKKPIYNPELHGYDDSEIEPAYQGWQQPTQEYGAPEYDGSEIEPSSAFYVACEAAASPALAPAPQEPRSKLEQIRQRMAAKGYTREVEHDTEKVASDRARSIEAEALRSEYLRKCRERK